MRHRRTLLTFVLCGLVALVPASLAASPGGDNSCGMQTPLPLGTKIVEVSDSAILVDLPDGALFLSERLATPALKIAGVQTLKALQNGGQIGGQVSQGGDDPPPKPAKPRGDISVNCTCSGTGNCGATVTQNPNGSVSVDCTNSGCDANCNAGVIIPIGTKSLGGGLIAADRIVRLATLDEVRSLPMAKLSQLLISAEARETLGEFSWNTLGGSLDLTLKRGGQFELESRQVLVRAYGYLVALSADAHTANELKAVVVSH